MKNNSEYQKMIDEARKKQLELYQEDYKETLEIYTDVWKSLNKKLKRINSNSLDADFTNKYKKIIGSEMMRLEDIIYIKNKKNMFKSAKNAADIHSNFFGKINEMFGARLDTNALNQIPKEVLDELAAGNIYKDNVGLSKRIWTDLDIMKKDFDHLLKRAMIEKKSAKRFSEDVRKYVKPNVKKGKEWYKNYKGIRKNKIEYNALRLSRTSIKHSHYLANVRGAKKNPFVEAMHWALSGEHYSRQIMPFGRDECDDYAEQDDYGLGRGNFPIDELPLPHPLCLCHQYAVITKTLEEIGEELNPKGETVKKAPKTKPKKRLSAKKEKINKLKDIYSSRFKNSQNSKKDFKNFAEDIFASEGIDVEIKLRKSKTPGACHKQVQFNKKNQTLNYYLEKVTFNHTEKNIREKASTVFHELFHAKACGKNIRGVKRLKDYRKWRDLEEVFAETSSRYLIKEMDEAEDLISAYKKEIVDLVPKLKKIEKFKKCETLYDIGEEALDYRFSKNKKVNFNDLIKKLDSVEIDRDYYKQYNKDIIKNLGFITDNLVEKRPHLKDHQNLLINQLREVVKYIDEGGARIPKRLKNVNDNAEVLYNLALSEVMKFKIY